MRQHIDRRAAFFLAEAPDQLQAVLPNPPAIFRVFVGYLPGSLERHSPLLFHAFRGADAFQLSLDGPRQIHRGRPRRFQLCGGGQQVVLERWPGRCFQRCQVHSVSRRRSDQSRPAHVHLFDRSRHLVDGAHFFDHETVRQKALIDQLNDAAVRFVRPDRPVMLTAYFHQQLECDQHSCKARPENQPVHEMELISPIPRREAGASRAASAAHDRMMRRVARRQRSNGLSDSRDPPFLCCSGERPRDAGATADCSRRRNGRRS